MSTQTTSWLTVRFMHRTKTMPCALFYWNCFKFHIKDCEQNLKSAEKVDIITALRLKRLHHLKLRQVQQQQPPPPPPQQQHRRLLQQPLQQQRQKKKSNKIRFSLIYHFNRFMNQFKHRKNISICIKISKTRNDDIIQLVVTLSSLQFFL